MAEDSCRKQYQSRRQKAYVGWNIYNKKEYDSENI